MLQITIPAINDLWDEGRQEFISTKEQTLQLEHSLVSLSKWESKWHKPFLHSDKTDEETLDYIKCMTITQNVDPNVYYGLNQNHVTMIHEYINNPMTATTFSDDRAGRKNREIITAEIIYYWMVSYNIPFECQKWHLNRLITLVRVCGAKNQPPKKSSKRDIASRYAELNRQRRAKLNSKG